MGGKTTGHRVMLTVPKEVYPELKQLADRIEMPVSGLIRLFLLEMLPTMKQVNEALDKTQRDGMVAGVITLAGYLSSVQAELSLQQKQAMDEVAAALKTDTETPKSQA